MEDYKTLYEQRIERAKEEIKKCGDNKGRIRMIENIFPELKESEDERIRKELIQYLKNYPNLPNGHYCRDDFFAWLEKQGETSDYNPYKETVKSISTMVEKYAQFGSDLQDFYNNVKVKCKDAIEYDKTFLEKQGEQPNKVSIWKHWNNGIAGNGEGKLIYLVKNGNTYMLSSSLGFECDYIELSDLDKLYAEKQGEQKPTDKVEPKWKKGNDGEFLYETSVVWIHNETKTLATAGLRLDSNTFYIPISELEKLPKE